MTERHYGFGNLPRKFDESFEGSLWEKMGYSNELCPICGAHLRSGICLNACHLTNEQRQTFRSMLKRVE
jgi:hypothetical protein